MALTINTNTASINAQRNLSLTQTQLNKSLERLSSGLRINRAGDDAAGLAISENMRAVIRGMSQAVRNANDGVSLLQTAEGALNESSNILIRMRELAVQSSTGTVTDSQRTSIQSEFGELTKEIDRISAATEFNGTALLAGAATMTFQIGYKNSGNDQISLNLTSASSTSLGVASTAVAVSSQTAAQNALATIDTAIASVSSLRGSFGAIQNRLTSTINNLQVSIENMSAAESRIRDVDVATETASLTRAQILTQAGTAILAQANQTPQSALSLLR